MSGNPWRVQPSELGWINGLWGYTSVEISTKENRSLTGHLREAVHIANNNNTIFNINYNNHNKKKEYS